MVRVIARISSKAGMAGQLGQVLAALVAPSCPSSTATRSRPKGHVAASGGVRMMNPLGIGAPATTDFRVRVETAIDVERPPQSVFDFVTTPALWHTWHPATVEVRGVPNRPLVAGETALELIAVAGRRDQALWTVQVCAPPWRWEIATDTDNGSAHIAYEIVAVNGGSRFRRTLAFRSKRWPWRALDSTLTRWLLERQSARALWRLKGVLER